MPNFREPRPISLDEPPELRLPCIIIVDTSSMMIISKNELCKGITALLRVLNVLAQNRADICLIGFGNETQILVPFLPAYDLHVPNFECGGVGKINSVIKMGLSELEARKEYYKVNQEPYSRPWIFMITSGNVDDSDSEEKVRLLQAQKTGACRFLPICVGADFNKDIIRSLNKDGVYLTTEDFQQACEWIGNSLNSIVSVPCGRNVMLPNPSDYNLELHYTFRKITN